MTLHPASYWRERAEEARAQMAEMTNPAARDAMRTVAENCDRLAQIMEDAEAKAAARDKV